MIFVPLLHYFKCKNSYSGNEYGLRYRMIPGKRTVPDPDGGEGATKEESILTVDYWPDPWTLEMTDPALRRQEIFPLTDEGRAAAASCLEDAFNADPERKAFWRVVDAGDGTRVFRYTEPLYVTESCLECHGDPVGELDQYG